MRNFDLIMYKGGRVPKSGRLSEYTQRFHIPAEGLLLGRSSKADVRLNEQQVSRRHARIWVEKGRPVVEDLGSRNGLTVNDSALRYAPLEPDDVLRIGSFYFRVAEATAPPEKSRRPHDTTISEAKSRSIVQELKQEMEGSRLSVLYRSTELLANVFDLDSLTQQLLDLIFEALSIRRGFVLAAADEYDEPEILASRLKESGDHGPPLSNTLIAHVFKTREAMKTVDAQLDRRFESTESIVNHGIHAAMCAPLLGRRDVVGAIYVDSGSTPGKPFTQDDLELLAAVARIAGVAVENARLYQKSMQQERMATLGMVTAGMGHCIKNILMGIRGGTFFIDRAIKDDNIEHVKTGWPVMARAIERIDALVMNMLTFSKDRKPERKPTEINKLIGEIVQTTHDYAETHKTKVVFEPGEEFVVHLDPQGLYRVLLNLINNAIEACAPQGGTVTVEAARVEDTANEETGLRVAITDTGRGIPDNIKPRLFDAFTSSRAGGTGLGLASSLKIVNEHGGSIQVDSQEGEGSTFTVWIPEEAEDAEAAQPALDVTVS